MEKAVEKIGEFLSVKENAELIEAYIIELGEKLHKQYYSIEGKNISDEEKMKQIKKLTAKIDVYKELWNELRKIVNEFVQERKREQKEKKKVEIV